MKRLWKKLGLSLVVCFALSLLCTFATAETTKVSWWSNGKKQQASLAIQVADPYLYAELPDGSIAIVLYFGDGNIAVADIAAAFPGKTVTSINDGAFDFWKEMEVDDRIYCFSCENEDFKKYYTFNQIIIPDTVQYLGSGWLPGLTADHYISYNIPEQLKYVGSDATSWLEISELPILDGSIVFEEGGQFNYIRSDSFTVPSTYTFVPAYWCSWCTSSEIVLSEGINTVETNAFNSISLNIEKVQLPSTLTRIEDYAFEGQGFWRRSPVFTVDLPDSLVYIGKNVFSNTNMKELTLPAHLEHLDETAFAGCPLETISLREGATSLPDDVFPDQTSVKVLNLPDSLVSIGKCVFLRSSLIEVVIPANVTTIGAAAFKNSENLKQITLPASLTSIADDAFSGCATDAVFTVFAGTYAEQWANARAYSANVLVPVETMTLSDSSVTISKGKSLTLKADVGPESATSKAVEWVSSNENVATVKNGKIQAKTTGTCDITCRATDGSGVKAVCHVEVIQMVTSVSTKTQKLTIPHGGSSTVEMTFKPADATNQSLQWESSDESICTVDAAGAITAIGSGDCTITATTVDGSNKSVKIKVHVPIFDTLEVNCTVTQKDGLLIPVGLHGASVKDVSHKASSDKYFLYYLDAEGLHIFPIAEGTAKITLTSQLNKNDKAVYTVTVEPSALYDTANGEAAPLNVIVTLDKSEVVPGESYTMKYHISGGVPPYTIAEAHADGISTLDLRDMRSTFLKGLEPSSGTKKLKALQSSGYDKEMITLTVLDSAGTICTGRSNTLDVDALRVYFNNDYYAWPKNQPLDIEYQIIGGSGSYNVVAVWSVYADGQSIDVLTEKQTSSDHGAISYTPSSGEQIALSLWVTDKNDKNYTFRIDTPWIVLTDGWSMVAYYDKEVAVGDTMTLRLGISGANTSKIKYSTLSLRQFDPASSWMNEIEEYAVHPYFLTFTSENDGISYAYSFTVPECDTIQLNVVLNDANFIRYSGTVTQVK